ncbi:glycine zipper domain-containing protein [uncultured Microbulbifer sp.]|uniref:glycine zipper domain-containing protein n=1 Tax=uncultured Microbulbifer sp. TaxID=348147 RepID=UPI00262C4456|nr:glycine zipper domain-containing protein [uncultured Microbulbifer sp.]
MQFQTIKRAGLASALALSLTTAGCANMSDTDRRVGTGIGIGAVTGALISGNPGGTAVGAALGGAGGWLYDRNQKRHYYYDSRGRRVYR